MIHPDLKYSPQTIIRLFQRVNSGTLIKEEQEEIRVHFDRLLFTGCAIWGVVVLSDTISYTIKFIEEELQRLIEEGSALGYLDNYHIGPQVKLTWDRIPRKPNNTKRIKEESEQKVIAAQAESEAMRIKTEALARDKSLIDYEAVQKWDGKLPTYMMGSSVPFINLK